MNLKPLLYYFILLFVTLEFFSCDAIIEPSLKNSVVTQEAPVNNYTTPVYTINFWWDAVDHSLSYHLQVVTPNFSAPGSLVLDTVVKGNKFAYNFSPGTYQWRVLAENGSSQTPFTTPRNFTVGASTITTQSVQLSAPANNYLTNQQSVLLQWETLYGATKYQIEIDTNNFANESVLILNETIPGTQLNFTFPKDQVYQWRVKAANDTVQAKWSSVYIMTYDHTPPGQVAVISPANGQTMALPVTLQWNAISSANRYKLYVFKSDSTTNFSSIFPAIVNATSYTFNQGNSGERIYWKVSAIDGAGNEGQASTLRSFVIQ
jgi:hypothetical protein